MFLSRIYTIFVLAFIGSQRSNASPSDRFQLGAELIKPPSQLLDGEETEGPVPQLTSDGKVESCPVESINFQEQLSKMVSDADELMEKQENLTAEETIVVLGNVGAGKTSLVQLLTGNADLQSRKLGAGNDSTYVFEDGKRIGTSDSGSFTLFPEIASFNTTINFVDTPGFQDTTQPAHEVAPAVIMKTIKKKN
ncbi:uncharacterized protein LOC120353215 [Nilaparvata lugens]|uniref:uncharacterized protein LOC120353215 n=1 Tax=Nilaparvata lugens TaxID=108931 RepID=UPI00193CDFD5|nr:uncharacterized protein LOC120353215 [Nilaparvata lugens]